VVLAAVLSGCSLFQRSSGEQSQSVPDVAASAAPSPGATGKASATSAAATPSASRAEPVPSNAPTPPAVPGYTIAGSDAAALKTFSKVTVRHRAIFDGLTSRRVVKGKAPVGSLVLLGLRPEIVGNTQIEQRLLTGIVAGLSGKGSKPSTQKIGGQTVFIATTKETNVVAWYRKGVVVCMLANGADTGPTLAFVKAYLAAG
jgi:hypothetical protein